MTSRGVKDLRDLVIPQSGLRPQSFEYLRAGGRVYGGGIQLEQLHDGSMHISDGRHRLTLAREAGELVEVTIRHIGPRGGLRKTERVKARV